MVREKFPVRLTPEERDRLDHLVRAGRSPARVATRARILLKTGEGWSAPKVAEALDVAESSVFRIKRRFAEDGLDGVLRDRPQAHRYRKLDDRAGAHLIALPAPRLPKAMTTGRCAHWPARRWNWAWWSPCPTRRCACSRKKHPQTVAAAAVVHS